MITKHPIYLDFPEFAEKIHSLKIDDAHFRKLFTDYDTLDHLIYNAESDTEPTTDENLNQMRIERVKLKDVIYNYLKNN